RFMDYELRSSMPAHQHELDELFDALADEQEQLLDATLDGVEVPPQEYADDIDLAGGFRPKLALEPRPYQAEALAAWFNASGRGTVILPTGAGKTMLALMAIDKLKLRTLI